jgi:ABC-type lipoprotein release transport system permease subunit
MLFSLAWRNVWRNKLRSGTVIASITIGLFGGIFSIAFMNGMADQQINNTINTMISHIQIHHPEFLLNEETQYAIDDTKEISDYIKNFNGVSGIAERTLVSGMVSSAETATGVMINGIIPDKEKHTTDLQSKLLEGSYFDTDKYHPILISSETAEKLNVKMKSKIVITAQSLDTNIVYGAFRVVGIYKTFNSMYDETNVFVKKSDLDELVGFDPAKANVIAVKLSNNDLTDSAAAYIKDKFPGLIENDQITVRTWNEIQPMLMATNELVKGFGFIFLIIIMIALAFGIINTMLMVVLERMREIGMLMAIGMNNLKVFLMIMLETVLLSLTGGILGMGLSGIVLLLTYKDGINLSSLADGFNAAGYSAIIYPEITAGFYLFQTVLVIVTALLASIYPARRALKLEPAEAVRHDV